MGQILVCSCRNCGYTPKNIYLGSGRMRGPSYFPALDSETKTVVQIDTKHLVKLIDRKELVINGDELDRLKNEGKIPYFVKGMYKKRLFSGKPISTEPTYLQSKSNLCPKCDKYKLAFVSGGMFD
jgi:hypothetical protein